MTTSDRVCEAAQAFVNRVDAIVGEGAMVAGWYLEFRAMREALRAAASGTAAGDAPTLRQRAETVVLILNRIKKWYATGGKGDPKTASELWEEVMQAGEGLSAELGATEASTPPAPGVEGVRVLKELRDWLINRVSWVSILTSKEPKNPLDGAVAMADRMVQEIDERLSRVVASDAGV